MSRTLAERAARALAPRMGRRGFLARTAMAGTALTAAPATYVLRPRSAYAAICNCNGSRCDCGSLCCDGSTEFCCTVTGMNRCPPGTLTGGWWKVDSSGYCGGGPGTTSTATTSAGPAAAGAAASAAAAARALAAAAPGARAATGSGGAPFRYGQCNQHVRCPAPSPAGGHLRAAVAARPDVHHRRASGQRHPQPPPALPHRLAVRQPRLGHGRRGRRPGAGLEHRPEHGRPDPGPHLHRRAGSGQHRRRPAPNRRGPGLHGRGHAPRVRPRGEERRTRPAPGVRLRHRPRW